MAQTPKRLTPKKRRDHLPALTPIELEAFTARLATAPVSEAAKRAALQSMTVAANPNAERPEVVIQSLEAAERQGVLMAQMEYQRTLGGMNARGRAALMQMSDEEFERVLNGAAE